MSFSLTSASVALRDMAGDKQYSQRVRRHPDGDSVCQTLFRPVWSRALAEVASNADAEAGPGSTEPLLGSDMRAQEPVGEDVDELFEKVGEVLDVGKRTTVTETVIHLCKSYVGSGALGLPYAFSLGGWLLSTVMVVVFGCLSYHCTILLLECRYKRLPAGQRVTYGDVAFHALGVPGKRVADALMIFTQLGFCAAYVIMISDMMSQMIPTVPPRHWSLFLVAPAFLALSLIRTMKHLAPASVIANIALFVAFFSVYFYSIGDVAAHGVHPGVVAFNPSGWFLALGMCAYVWEGIGLSLSIEGAMQEPRRFPRVLGGVYVFLFALYISASVIAYFAFGPDIGQVVTRSLPANMLLSIVRVLVATSVALTYPVMVYPCFEMAELALFRHQPQKATTWRVNQLRLLICTGIVLAALVIPHFGLVLSLIGSLGAAAIAFVVPAACHLAVFRTTTSRVVVWKNYAIIAVGTAMAIYGTTMTVMEMLSCIIHPTQAFC